MDAMTLRIVLLILGLAFLAGIYFYETGRRRRESAQARRRVMSKVEPSIELETREASEDYEGPSGEEDEALFAESAPQSEPADPLDFTDDDEAVEEFASLRIDDEPIPELDTPMASEIGEREKRLRTPSSTRQPMQQQELFGFSAREESPADVPDLILQINVRARSGGFSGDDIRQAMQETGLQLSDAAVYQRLASDGSRKVLYNIASMVEPGVFPVKKMDGFVTPGLTLFTQLPGAGDSMMIFTDMLYTAERLAALLDGDLQDESRSALTKQTIEHLRERILEHKRQIQLARRKG